MTQFHCNCQQHSACPWMTSLPCQPTSLTAQQRFSIIVCSGLEDFYKCEDSWQTSDRTKTQATKHKQCVKGPPRLTSSLKPSSSVNETHAIDWVNSDFNESGRQINDISVQKSQTESTFSAGCSVQHMDTFTLTMVRNWVWAGSGKSILSLWIQVNYSIHADNKLSDLLQILNEKYMVFKCIVYIYI